MIETNRRKYGVDFPTQLAEIQQKIVQTNLKKYGTERASQSEKVKIKAIQTNLERYGVENYTQTPEYLDKVKKTNLELYGVENVRQNKEIDAKARATTKKIYGVENVFYSEDFQEKIKKINKQNWGVSNPSQVPEFQEKINKSVLKTYFRKLFEKDDKGSFIILNFNFCEPLITEKDFKGTGADHYYKFKCNKCNSIFEDYISAGAEKVHPFCPHCEPSLSLPQKEIFTFMKDHDNIRDLIKLNDKIVLNGREVDILINDLKLGIEIDGIFFHSSYSLYKFKSNEISKPINYHLDKSKNCSDKNLNLIHILDKEWKNNKELNKNFLNHILKCHENIEGLLINDPLNLSEDINKLIFNISDNSNLYNSFSINWYPENNFGFLEEKNIFYINIFYGDKELASFKVKDIEAKNFYIVNWAFKYEENSEYLDYKIIRHLKNFLKKEFQTFEDLFIINNKFKIGNFSYLLNNVYLEKSEPPRGLVIDNVDHKFRLKDVCTSSTEVIEETLQLYKNIFFDCGAELYKIL